MNLYTDRLTSFQEGKVINNKKIRWRYQVIPQEHMALLGFYYEPYYDENLEEIIKDSVICIHCNAEMHDLGDCRNSKKNVKLTMLNIINHHLEELERLNARNKRKQIQTQDIICLPSLLKKLILQSVLDRKMIKWFKQNTIKDPFSKLMIDFTRSTYLSSEWGYKEDSNLSIDNMVKSGLFKYDISLTGFNEIKPSKLARKRKINDGCYCIYCKYFISNLDVELESNFDVLKSHYINSRDKQCFFIEQIKHLANYKSILQGYDQNPTNLLTSPKRKGLNSVNSTPVRKMRKLNRTSTIMTLDSDDSNASNSSNISYNNVTKSTMGNSVANRFDLKVNFQDHVDRTREFNRRNRVLDDSTGDFSFDNQGQLGFELPPMNVRLSTNSIEKRGDNSGEHLKDIEESNKKNKEVDNRRNVDKGISQVKTIFNEVEHGTNVAQEIIEQQIPRDNSINSSNLSQEKQHQCKQLARAGQTQDIELKHIQEHALSHEIDNPEIVTTRESIKRDNYCKNNDYEMENYAIMSGVCNIADKNEMNKLTSDLNYNQKATQSANVTIDSVTKESSNKAPNSSNIQKVIAQSTVGNYIHAVNPQPETIDVISLRNAQSMHKAIINKQLEQVNSNLDHQTDVSRENFNISKINGSEILSKFYKAESMNSKNHKDNSQESLKSSSNRVENFSISNISKIEPITTSTGNIQYGKNTGVQTVNRISTLTHGSPASNEYDAISISSDEFALSSSDEDENKDESDNFGQKIDNVKEAVRNADSKILISSYHKSKSLSKDGTDDDSHVIDDFNKQLNINISKSVSNIHLAGGLQTNARIPRKNLKGSLFVQETKENNYQPLLNNVEPLPLHEFEEQEILLEAGTPRSSIAKLDNITQTDIENKRVNSPDTSSDVNNKSVDISKNIVNSNTIRNSISNTKPQFIKLTPTSDDLNKEDISSRLHSTDAPITDKSPIIDTGNTSISNMPLESRSNANIDMSTCSTLDLKGATLNQQVHNDATIENPNLQNDSSKSLVKKNAHEIPENTQVSSLDNNLKNIHSIKQAEVLDTSSKDMRNESSTAKTANLNIDLSHSEHKDNEVKLLSLQQTEVCSLNKKNIQYINEVEQYLTCIKNKFEKQQLDFDVIQFINTFPRDELYMDFNEWVDYTHNKIKNYFNLRVKDIILKSNENYEEVENMIKALDDDDERLTKIAEMLGIIT
ncbi:hypothetical protein TBLA_0F00490 [Henningerozyma blattae CBS 6284]|uniref:Uncharacterized protein n=1 Tax=Henningerozyma blattae (strain ATCC 34711 / CBS 6284 / DSM 70876 / NBRC 10599 / NRRL Y-10934 / UCD 77-7) TaxID=1071380 RepID=I2H5E1_HENB6|nr:hypothetical protein TBLA_0F00490 [Tetrapisispora blattae CBS 6284]CCH61593.1 hypothetical protein TBLA_0F00490 [Tetrapisispora blattae CBS 6284]